LVNIIYVVEFKSGEEEEEVMTSDLVRVSVGSGYKAALTNVTRTDVWVLTCENLESKIYIFKIWLVCAVIRLVSA